MRSVATDILTFIARPAHSVNPIPTVPIRFDYTVTELETPFLGVLSPEAPSDAATPVAFPDVHCSAEIEEPIGCLPHRVDAVITCRRGVQRRHSLCLLHRPLGCVLTTVSSESRLTHGLPCWNFGAVADNGSFYNEDSKSFCS